MLRMSSMLPLVAPFGGAAGREQNESDPKRPEIFDDWQHQ